MHSKERILIIDDEIGNLNMLKIRLEHDSFEVITAEDPREGLLLAREKHPDIVILDLNMPIMNGFEVCKKLKSDFETSQTPVIMLTCMGDTEFKIEGLEGAGADDYLVKDEIDPREISARIRSILRRMRDSISVNPLTHLPGNRAIMAELERRKRAGENFVVGYLDIDNFKAYNDIYGFQNGDTIILAVAETMRSIVRKDENAFLGHVGGDDFVFISSVKNAENIASEIVSVVAQKAPFYYTVEHRNDGGIHSVDRDCNPKFFPFFSVSIALIPSETASNADEFGAVGTILKKKLKALGGNRYGGPEIL